MFAPKSIQGGPSACNQNVSQLMRCVTLISVEDLSQTFGMTVVACIAHVQWSVQIVSVAQKGGWKVDSSKRQNPDHKFRRSAHVQACPKSMLVLVCRHLHYNTFLCMASCANRIRMTSGTLQKHRWLHV